MDRLTLAVPRHATTIPVGILASVRDMTYRPPVAMAVLVLLGTFALGAMFGATFRGCAPQPQQAVAW